MRITKRDKEVIDFIKEYRILTSSQIQRLFNMSQPLVSKRMNFIVDNINELKKMQYSPSLNLYDNRYKQILKNENVFYWKKKPSAVTHDVLLMEFYIKLLELQEEYEYKLISFEKEVPLTVDDEFIIRVDARIILEYKGGEYEYLVELENNKSFNSNKYKTLEDQGYIFPPLLVISDRRVYNKCKNLEIIKMKLNLSNFNNFTQDFQSNPIGVKYKINV